MKNEIKVSNPSNSDVENFEILSPMLKSNLSEIKELSKKKQDDPLNLLKVKSINKKLELVRDLLKNEPTFNFLTVLDEASLPTNSDAVLIMAEYVEAMELYRKKYYTLDNRDFQILGEHYSWKKSE